MDPTTLVTFLFRSPPETRAVELFGSWDNFEQPYRMHHDRRRGNGIYTGCFAFENIVFDGDIDLQASKPRSGGLKQGGTYWYYYRLNYYNEAFDHSQPHTTACPLLPGQEINVIDVPIELLDLPSRCHSAYGDIVGSLTDYQPDSSLDPASKWALLSPPPISKIHLRCASDDALDGRLEGRALAEVRNLESTALSLQSKFTRPRSRHSNVPDQSPPRSLIRKASLSSRPHSPGSASIASNPPTRPSSHESTNLPPSSTPSINPRIRRQPSNPFSSAQYPSLRAAVLSILHEDNSSNEDLPLNRPPSATELEPQYTHSLSHRYRAPITPSPPSASPKNNNSIPPPSTPSPARQSLLKTPSPPSFASSPRDSNHPTPSFHPTPLPLALPSFSPPRNSLGALWTYSLPPPTTTDSNHSLAKSVSVHSYASREGRTRHTGRVGAAAAPDGLFGYAMSEDTAGLAEGVWTELGYLGESIA